MGSIELFGMEFPVLFLIIEGALILIGIIFMIIFAASGKKTVKEEKNDKAPAAAPAGEEKPRHIKLCDPDLMTTLFESDIEERITIGREGCDITIDDPELSPKQCEIGILGFRYTITDLGSGKGTKINGYPVEVPVFLENECLLEIGAGEYLVILD